MSNKFSVMRLINDHAVLQSECENRIFGYAAPGTKVLLTITGKDSELSLSAAATDSGRWEMTVPPFGPSCEAYTFTFAASGEALTFDDICFGELFHISGQSNMELPMFRTVDPFKPETFPLCGAIREFRVPVMNCFGRDEEYEDFQGGEWAAADCAENTAQMSAAGYYFALEIHKKFGVPVGLLNTSAGGAPVEARMPYSMLSEFGWYDDFLKECTADGYMRRTEAEDAKRNERRYAELDRLDSISDRIFDGDVRFEKCTVPCDLHEIPALNGFCGRVWFRKSFEIPEDANLSDIRIILGTLTDADKTYLNGTFIGETGYMYPPRIYDVPAGTAVHGKNTLLVCLDVRYGSGGFTKSKRYCVMLNDMTTDLSGEWEYAAAAKVPPMKREVFFQGLPLSMYAALTAPAFAIKCRAMLWYQGESNCNHPDRYAFLFRKFVEMYRERCGYDIPVITTQLCNFDDPFCGGVQSWAMLRQAQLECLSVPGTDMAVIIDVGEWNDLHPLNKKDVGKRLALCTLRTVYGDKDVPPDVFCTGASYSGSGKVLLHFDDLSRVVLAENGSAAFDGCLPDDSVITASDAEMTDEGLLITFAAPDIPETVRCEWSNAPEVIALRTTEGLPLSPFAVKVKAGE